MEGHIHLHWEKVQPWKRDSSKVGVTARLINTKNGGLGDYWDLNPSLLAIEHDSPELGNKSAVSPVLEDSPSSPESSGIGQRQWRGCGMQEHRFLMGKGSPYS